MGQDNKNTTEGCLAFAKPIPGGAAGYCLKSPSEFQGVSGLSLLSPHFLSPASGHGEKGRSPSKLSQQIRCWHLPRGVRSLESHLAHTGTKSLGQLTLSSLTSTPHWVRGSPRFIAPWARKALVLGLSA